MIAKLRLRSRDFLILLTALALPAFRLLFHIWLCSAFQRTFSSLYVSQLLYYSSLFEPLVVNMDFGMLWFAGDVHCETAAGSQNKTVHFLRRRTNRALCSP